MDSGSGHIYNVNEINLNDLIGKAVPWKVGEEVEVNGCLFVVKEIRTFPYDEIVLRGKENLKPVSFDEKLESMKEIGENVALNRAQRRAIKFGRTK
jgi:hypothetical protein